MCVFCMYVCVCVCVCSKGKHVPRDSRYRLYTGIAYIGIAYIISHLTN